MNDRHDRVLSLIKEQVAVFIAGEANTDPLITVTGATISPDYRNATIFFTTIPEGKEENALIFLRRSGGAIRHYVMKHTKMKIIPKLDFAVDFGERHRQRIDDIVREQGLDTE